MAEPTLVSLERVFLRNHPQIKEAWIQRQLADRPMLLGLGELVLKDKERMQPKAGRLDLLFADVDNTRRYEVEVQLGKTDETHIIRTLEYWDLERKRYPQYEHVAVIVAEEITARFLNVIHLFNGHIPLIALQMAAYRVNDGYALTMVRVLDEQRFGVEEEKEQTRTNREEWQTRAPQAVAIADRLLALVKPLDPAYQLSYLKQYIGFTHNGAADNICCVEARKNGAVLAVRLEWSAELDKRISDAGLEVQKYDAGFGHYRIRITAEEIDQRQGFFSELLERVLKEE